MKRKKISPLNYTIRNGVQFDATKEIRKYSLQIFAVAFIIRMVAVLATIVFASTIFGEFSRDSLKYVTQGETIAQAYSFGFIQWDQWIDHGWYQFIGVVFLVFGPQIVVLQTINVTLAACSAVLVFRVTFVLSRDIGTARFAGIVFCILPSMVYFSVLPLKEAAAIFGIMAICYGLIKYLAGETNYVLIWLTTGLLIITSLRLYLVFLLAVIALICLLVRHFRGGMFGLVQASICVALLGGSIYFGVTSVGFEPTDSDMFMYYDIDNLNAVRHDMVTGNAKFFESKEDAKFGGNLVEDALKLLKGMYYFLFSIDLLNITRSRQLAAAPEMIFIFISLPSLVAGIYKGWKRNSVMVLPIIMIAFTLMLVYSAGTTNMGSMYRWRLQAIPFIAMLIAYGGFLRKRGWVYVTIKSLTPKLSRPRSQQSIPNAAPSQTPAT